MKKALKKFRKFYRRLIPSHKMQDAINRDSLCATPKPSGDWDFSHEEAFKGLTNKEIFAQIYKSALWGGEKGGDFNSGPGSHDPSVVTPYAKAVLAYFGEQAAQLTFADLGCGDFNVGSQLFKHTRSYLGCDIFDGIIEQNKSRYHAPNLSFRILDLAADVLPEADVLLVRQVLQHLSNEDIHRFVSNLRRNSTAKYLVVTEHVPGGYFEANNDKPSGAGIRIAVNSGIRLHEEPFSLKSKKFNTICRVLSPANGSEAWIETIVYEL